MLRFSIQYADQSGASGTVATDSVTVAGLTVESQGFGAVTNETGGFNHGVSYWHFASDHFLTEPNLF